jgi:SH3-like domain-containing protein
MDPAQLQQARSTSTSPLPPVDELNLNHNNVVIPSRSNTASPAVSVTGCNLELQWRSLQNVEYLTDGGNSWIHTAVLNGRPVVVKTLKPECQDLAVAMNEIEDELGKRFLREIRFHDTLHSNVTFLFSSFCL